MSGRVVNTVRSAAGVLNETCAPTDRPIQFFCIVRTFSGQSMWSKSASSRSA